MLDGNPTVDHAVTMRDWLWGGFILLFGGVMVLSSVADWASSGEPHWFFVGFGLFTIALGLSWIRETRN